MKKKILLIPKNPYIFRGIFNLELLNLTNINENLNIIKLKEVIDEYIKTKIINIKQSKEIIFNLYSLNKEGFFDLKYVLDYKKFYFYNLVSEDYLINILYETNSEYKIIIKQNEFIIKNQDYDINKLEENILDEICKRSLEKNMVLTYK